MRSPTVGTIELEIGFPWIEIGHFYGTQNNFLDFGGCFNGTVKLLVNSQSFLANLTFTNHTAAIWA